MPRVPFPSLSSLALSCVVLALVAPPVAAAPPEVPARLVVKVGKPAVFDVKPDAGKEIAFAPGFDKSKCPVFQLQSRPGAPAAFFALPDEAGTYYLTFWSVGDKDAAFSQLVIVATPDGREPGTVPPPKDKDPVTPPPTSSLYFLVVRADGPADPSFARTMSLPEWATLKAAGHTYKDKTATEAALLGVKVPAGQTLPAVFVLRVRPDGKSSELVAVAPLPTTGEGVKALPALVK